MNALQLTDKQLVTLLMCIEGRIEWCKDRLYAEPDASHHWEEQIEEAQDLYEMLDDIPVNQKS